MKIYNLIYTKNVPSEQSEIQVTPFLDEKQAMAELEREYKAVYRVMNRAGRLFRNDRTPAAGKDNMWLAYQKPNKDVVWLHWEIREQDTDIPNAAPSLQPGAITPENMLTLAGDILRIIRNYDGFDDETIVYVPDPEHPGYHLCFSCEDGEDYCFANGVHARMKRVVLKDLLQCYSKDTITITAENALYDILNDADYNLRGSFFTEINALTEPYGLHLNEEKEWCFTLRHN